MAKKQTEWMKHLLATFKKMKAKDKSVSLSDAMKVAKKTYKK